MSRTALLILLANVIWGAMLPAAGQSSGGLRSSEEIRRLEKRIQVLEQLVQRLQEQVQPAARSSSSAGGSRAEAGQGAPPQPVGSEAPRDTGIRVSGLLFGDYYWLADHHDPDLENRHGFWVRRVYLGFDRSLRRNLDARLRFEMNSAGDFGSSSKLEPFVKDAYLRWKFAGRHEAYLGLSSTPIWGSVESVWGYRSVEKTFADLQRLGSSRDMGLALKGAFDEKKRFRYHFQAGNGSGTGTETDQGKKVAIALGVHPSSSVAIEFYTDFEARPLDTDRRTFQGFVSYQKDRGRLGLHYLHQTRQGNPDLELDGLSLFGVYRLSSRASLFGRYDRMFDPNPDGNRISYLPFDPSAESNLFLAGVDFKLTDEFSLIPNVEVIRYDRREDGTRPGGDLVPRLTFFYSF